jgi:hypothetical protein
MEEMVILVLLGRAHMCKWQALAAMLDKQARELSSVGLQSSAYMTSATLDLSIVLQQGAPRLLKEGLTHNGFMIHHGEGLRVQVIADASNILNATKKNRTVVILKM